MVVVGTGGLGSKIIRHEYKTESQPEVFKIPSNKHNHSAFSPINGDKLRNITIGVSLGLWLSTSISEAFFDSCVDELVSNNIYIMREVSFFNSVALSDYKAAIVRAVAKGAKYIWGVGSDALILTAANWATYKAAVLSAATWAQANGVYEFEIGNEEEFHIDGTTLTEAQLIVNLKALATEAKSIFTNGNVIYTTAGSKSDAWIAAGKGDLDLIGFNVSYAGIWATAPKILSAFGADGTFLSEFDLNGTNINNYSKDEDVQAGAVLEMINFIDDLGFKRSLYYNFCSDEFGARKENGTYRKLWNVLRYKKRYNMNYDNFRF